MNKVRFGPSGNSQIMKDMGLKSSVQAPSVLHALGLDAYEYSFGRGITMSETTAKELGEECKKFDCNLSLHAPFYINFASTDSEKLEKSFGYVQNSLKFLQIMQGQRIVIHTASLGSDTRGNVLSRCRSALKELSVRIEESGFGKYQVALETMGRMSQIGTADEIIDFCKISNCFIPCFDFGHINSYLKGGLNLSEYRRIFDYAYANLDETRVRNCHVHFSKIKFADKGEIKHLNYDDEGYDIDFGQFSQVIREYSLTPTIICESATNMAEDAMNFKRIYTDM